MPTRFPAAAAAVLALVLRAPGQTLPAATAPEPQNPQNVAQLVHDLASADFATRERAQAVLNRLGPSSVDELQKLAGKQTDPEVQARILQGVEMIEEIQATDPAHISVDADQVALTRIAEMLGKSLGMPMTISGANDAYSLKVTDASFPEIMQILNRQHPLWLLPFSSLSTMGQPALTRLTGVWEESMAWRGFGIFVRDGALPLPAGAAKVAAGRGGIAADVRSLVLGIVADPRIRLVQIHAPVITAVMDNANKSWPTLPVGSPAVSLVVPRPCAIAQTVQIFMPSNSTNQIAVLRGQVVVDVALTEEQVVLPNIAEKLNQPITVGNCELTLTKFTVTDQKQTKALNLQVTYKLIHMAAGPSSQPAIVTVLMQDSDGKEVVALGLRGGTGNLSFGTTLTGKEPTRIIITAPLRVKTITIPFEFKNLPLPAPIAAAN